MNRHEVTIGPVSGHMTLDEVDLVLNDMMEAMTRMATEPAGAIMAESKKKAAKKPAKPKKTAFVPKIKSTKRNGLGTY